MSNARKFPVFGGREEHESEKIPGGVPFQQVDLDQGFWQERQRINRDVSIWNVYKRFQETGRFDALSCDWREGMPNKPHVFWDSDVAKWMEAAAFLLEKKPDPQLEAAVDELVDRIADHQDADGYFNTYFTACEPEARFTRRTDHRAVLRRASV